MQEKLKKKQHNNSQSTETNVRQKISKVSDKRSQKGVQFPEKVSKPTISSEPDSNTQKEPFFSGGAPNQVFRLQLCFFSYGTDDKSHAASLLLSLMIGMLLTIVFIIGAIAERSWISDALSVLGTAFTFVAGVAIGKSSSRNK